MADVRFRQACCKAINRDDIVSRLLGGNGSPDVPLLPLYYPNLFFIAKKAVFDQWYFTPGGFAGGIPTIFNKQAFITGRKTGMTVRPTSGG